jgi:hypothetical protein
MKQKNYLKNNVHVIMLLYTYPCNSFQKKESERSKSGFVGRVFALPANAGARTVRSTHCSTQDKKRREQVREPTPPYVALPPGARQPIPIAPTPM